MVTVLLWSVLEDFRLSACFYNLLFMDLIFCLYNSEKVVSTALLQIFGREVAEVPLVATSLDHQGQVTTVSLDFKYVC